MWHLTRLAVRHPWRVVSAWLLVLVAGVVVLPSLFGGLSSDVGEVPGSESSRALDLLSEDAPYGPTIWAVADGRTVDAGLRREVDAALATVATTPGVDAVSPVTVADDRRALAWSVHFTPTSAGWDAVDPVASRLRAIDVPHMVVGGGPLQDDEMQAQAQSDVGHAELYSMPVVAVLLVLAFGGLVAAGLPLMIAIISVFSSFITMTLVSLVFDVSVYAVNVVTMLGLGLAVDYALLIVSRFREERARDPEVARALERTMATAGRTVAFSGLTVGVSLAGLLVFPDTFLRSMGVAGMSVVLLALAAAVTLLPAVLALVGHRIKAAEPRRPRWGVLGLLSGVSARRPLAVLAVVVPLLLLVGLPFTSAEWADADATSLPTSSASRQLADLAPRFGPDTAKAEFVTVVLTHTVSDAQRTAYVERLRSLPGVLAATVRPRATGVVAIDLQPSGTSQGPTARRLVNDVRATPAPAPRLVTGAAAWLVDYEAMIAHRLPFALAFLVLATWLLLWLFTGSVVIGVKAILTTTLSLGASLGSLVWVFQDGHLGGLVGTQALGSLSITTPVVMCAIAFGLSMDYEVFLLGRMSEHWRRTHDNAASVDVGLRSTGRIVTTAAALMVIVFAGYVAGRFSPVKQIGLGLALAVLLDATVVRMFVVPAAMILAGRWTWWSPPALARLHERVGLTHESTQIDLEPHRLDATLDARTPAGRKGVDKLQSSAT